MNDFYLVFDTEATGLQVLTDAGLLQEVDGRHLPTGTDFALDLIGPIVQTAATFDSAGNMTSPAVMDNRYHVNLRIAALPASLDAYQITPATPSVRFAPMN